MPKGTVIYGILVTTLLVPTVLGPTIKKIDPDVTVINNRHHLSADSTNAFSLETLDV